MRDLAGQPPPENQLLTTGSCLLVAYFENGRKYETESLTGDQNTIFNPKRRYDWRAYTSVPHRDPPRKLTLFRIPFGGSHFTLESTNLARKDDSQNHYSLQLRTIHVTEPNLNYMPASLRNTRLEG